MSFATLSYLTFLVLCVSIYWGLPHRVRWIVLLIGSYVFYGFWKIEYIGLLASVTLISYIFGANIARSKDKKAKKWYLIAGLPMLVAVLGYFKYASFIVEIVSDVYGFIAQHPTSWMIQILLPVGISFFIFQCISYIVDVYRDRSRQETHLGYFSIYVTFFPQLVAGPIERSDHILPQLRASKKFQSADWYSGWKQILWGLFKKIVVADQAGLFVDQVYANSPTASGLMLLLATYAFAVQIYADFSGYCDIALGSASLFGIRLSKNFDQPYLASSIGDFWKRWHITLLTWFRDYIYIPLGGNRSHHMRNIFLVFLISGLWHGAAWTFIIWGLLHGVCTAIEHVYGKRKWLDQVPHWTKVLVTFHIVCALWIPFRASSLSSAGEITTRILGVWEAGWGNLSFDGPLLAIIALSASVMILGEWLYAKIGSLRIQSTVLRWAVIYVCIVSIVIFGRYGDSPFIYFQF